MAVVQRNSYVWRGILILLGLTMAVCAPLFVSGFLELGAAQRARGNQDHAAAAAHFRAAVQRLPWRSDLWEQAGRETLAAGDPERAIQELTRSPELSSTGWLALGEAYRLAGQMEHALQAYRVSLNYDATAEAYAGLASINREQGDTEAERAALQNLLLLDPGNAAAQYRLGLLLSLIDPDSALAHLEAASRLDPEYEPVVETLTSTFTLAELGRSEGDRLVTIGRGLGLAGEWRLASSAFEQAVAQEPGSAAAWAWLGEARQHLGQTGHFELDHALQIDPNSIVVRGLLGLYWKRAGDYRQALAEYQAAFALEPGNPTWAVALGEAYARLGDLVAASSNYQRAVEIAPGESAYWRLLATFCVENNVQVRDIGLPAAQRSVELAPEDAMALDILGWTQLALGESQAALQSLLKATGVEPSYAAAHLHLAMVYLQLSDRNAAYEELQETMSLDPDGSTGRQAADMLKQYFP